MDKTLGLLPVSISNENMSESCCGGPVVLFSILTACCRAYGQKPVRGGRVARDEVGSQHFHDGADGALCDAVQLVHVWGTSRVVYEFVVHELGELVREELAGLVRVQCADDGHGLRLPDAAECFERCKEATDIHGCVRLGAHGVAGYAGPMLTS